MKNITIFCGSSLGSDSSFEKEALLLGKTLAEKSIGVIYGGAKIGLMGAVAKGALDAGGKVIGVLPNFLKKKEVLHEELSELILVASMHERKMKMHDLCDGFIMLPGGIGTLEEFFEILTWAQLGRHRKPIGVLNAKGYYDDLLAFMQQMIDKKFLRPVHLELFIVSDTIDDLMLKMQHYQAPPLPRWMGEDQE